MCSTDEWEVELGDHLKSEINKLKESYSYVQSKVWKLEDRFNGDTPKMAAQALADKYLAGRNEEAAFQNIASLAGGILQNSVRGDVKPVVLLGVILERAGIDLKGDNGLVGEIKKAAKKLAADEKFIRSLVEREIQRVVRLAVEAAIEKDTLEAVAAEIKEELRGKLPFNTKKELTKYYANWWEKNGWCDMGEAVSMSVHRALREVMNEED
uniref:Uncharacterized protein n=1 Tax=viral metagenome TaxID=1070528 RepID=A0A6M3KGD3_9ZZZZ